MFNTLNIYIERVILSEGLSQGKCTRDTSAIPIKSMINVLMIFFDIFISPVLQGRETEREEDLSISD